MTTAMTRKRSRSLDEGPPPLAVQLMSLRDMEESHHTEVISKLNFIQDRLDCPTDFRSDLPFSKRMKLDINSTELIVPNFVKRAAESPVQNHNQQFSMMMKNFIASILQTAIKEASRKAASSKLGLLMLCSILSIS